MQLTTGKRGKDDQDERIPERRKDDCRREGRDELTEGHRVDFGDQNQGKEDAGTARL